MKLTNSQIEDAVRVLSAFNPKEVPLKTTLRLSRNLRKLKTAWDDFQHDRIRLAASVVTDQSRVSMDGKLNLTAAEQQKFEEKFKELIAQSQEIELRTLEFYDGASSPKPMDSDHAIDCSKTHVDPVTLSTLIDVVLVEVANGSAESEVLRSKL